MNHAQELLDACKKHHPSIGAIEGTRQLAAWVCNRLAQIEEALMVALQVDRQLTDRVCIALKRSDIIVARYTDVTGSGPCEFITAQWAACRVTIPVPRLPADDQPVEMAVKMLIDKIRAVLPPEEKSDAPRNAR